MNLVNRRRFVYTWRDIVDYVFHCICIRKLKFRRFNGPKHIWNEKIKKHYQFNEGEDKLFDELDVVTLLKAIRKIKVISHIVMN